MRLRRVRWQLAEHPAYTPALVARIETLVQLGRVSEANESLASLDESASAETRYAKALALQAMQRYAEALDLLTPLLPPVTPREGADPMHVLRAAELSMVVSDFRAAETWYTLLAEIDPSRDEAYAGLITLYAPNGPLAGPPAAPDGGKGAGPSAKRFSPDDRHPSPPGPAS